MWSKYQDTQNTSFELIAAMASWILFLEETSETSPSNAAQVQELLAGDAWHLSSPSPRMPQGSRENPSTPALRGSQVWTSRELLNRCDSCAQITGGLEFFGVNLSPKMVAVTCFSVSVSPNFEIYSLLLQMKMGKGQHTFQTEAAPPSGFGETTAATGQRFPCPEI